MVNTGRHERNEVFRVIRLKLSSDETDCVNTSDTSDFYIGKIVVAALFLTEIKDQNQRCCTILSSTSKFGEVGGTECI